MPDDEAAEQAVAVTPAPAPRGARGRTDKHTPTPCGQPWVIHASHFGPTQSVNVYRPRHALRDIRGNKDA